MTKKELVDKLLHEMVMGSKKDETFTYQQIGNQVEISNVGIRQIEVKDVKKAKFKLQQLAKTDG